MNPLASPSIQVRSIAGGKRYILPQRKLGKGRWFGLVLLIFGLLVTAFMFFWMWNPLREALSQHGFHRVFLIVFGLLGTPGLLVGLLVDFLGIALMAGATHSEIEVAGGHLASVEHIGPFHWTRRKSSRGIQQLVLMDAAGIRTPQGPKQARNGLRAIRTRGGPSDGFILAPAYPPELLQPLAQMVADEISATASDPIATNTTPVQVVEETTVLRDLQAEQDGALIRTPPATAIIVQNLPDGIAVSVPPAGLRKGSKGLFFFALAWNSFIAVFLVVAIASMTRNDHSRHEALPLIGFLLVFAMVGAAITLAAVNMGRRKALLAVTHGRLTVRRTGVFGTREVSVPISDIAAVCSGPSGMEVNDVPVMELQVWQSDGRKHGLLSQCTNAELDWLAALLRRTLHVPAQRP